MSNLVEELEQVAKTDYRELRQPLKLLLVYLLKWMYQPERRSASWRNTIRMQRSEIDWLLEDSPSLRTRLTPENMTRIWNTALADAAAETGIAESGFPRVCPWDLESQILNSSWWPGA